MSKIQEANFSQQEKETFLKMSLEVFGHGGSQSFKPPWTTKEESKESLLKVCIALSWRREQEENDLFQGGYGHNFKEEKMGAFVLFLTKWRLECLDLVFKDQKV